MCIFSFQACSGDLKSKERDSDMPYKVIMNGCSLTNITQITHEDSVKICKVYASLLSNIWSFSTLLDHTLDDRANNIKDDKRQWIDHGYFNDK